MHQTGTSDPARRRRAAVGPAKPGPATHAGPLPEPAKRKPTSRLGRRLLVLLLLVGLLAAAGYWRFVRQNFRRLAVVRPSVLYRSGQLSEHGLRYLARTHGVRTILCLRLNEPRLRRGLLLDPFGPRGDTEPQYAAKLGLRHLHWPLGEEVYWPWLTPWQFEEFFKLMDDPANLPVLVHCMGGQHRTGTYVALFRLEYDRWDVERTLAEMHSFDFGSPRLIQEHNLRTYLPRPRPDHSQWGELSDGFAAVFARQPPADYEQLVRRLRQSRSGSAAREALEQYVSQGRPFALPLAERLIASVDDPLAAGASKLAAECLKRSGAEAADWSSAAAAVADFGSQDQQQQLLALLREEGRGEVPSPRYQAVVAGVTNRYSPNRVAFLRPILDDHRQRLAAGAQKYRYCDTAVARLTSIVDLRFRGPRGPSDLAIRDRAVRSAIMWFDDHHRPSQLQEPSGRNRPRPPPED